MPSPVMASAEPEASPVSATLPATTRSSLRVVVSAPRILLSSAAPSICARSAGRLARTASILVAGERATVATQISSGPTGVM
jgi:hypothetical protein